MADLNPLRLVFFGSDKFSKIPLQTLSRFVPELIQSIDVVTTSEETVVADCARSLNLKLLDKSSVVEQKFDVGVVASYGLLIPKATINSIKWGLLNIHPSILPRHRGASPLIHTILCGDKRTGVSIMKIHPEKFDVGEILACEGVDVPADIIMSQLRDQLAELGTDLLLKCLRDLPGSLARAQPQSADGVSYAKKVTVHDSVINFACMDAHEIYTKYRALHEVNPLRTGWGSYKIQLHELSAPVAVCSKCDRVTDVPGAVYYCKHSNSLHIRTKENLISCGSVTINRKMTAKSFHNGYLTKDRFKGVTFD